ncbi:hypothetical protein QNH20_12490 [Neobacillus sp. WH10]|uniref:hypothetical protein n=1 Tax=Neobacillus sp. WH10 TaxID=3047873 RepID=UPI0024C1E3C6|nr:hypothetical protein [Neobacillus sp. WH10]WHY79905.1 hypothetical protein QNH20_12490 [Neobacillus sp. WH10]
MSKLCLNVQFSFFDMVTPINLLLLDIQSIGANISSWIELINRVLGGDSDYEEGTGNSITFEVSKPFTKVINNFANEDIIEECIIETTELKEIIILWELEFNYRRKKGEL